MNSKILTIVFCLILTVCGSAFGTVKGIYISQPTLENTKQINYLIKRANEAGVNTFVIDFNKMTNRYRENIALVKENHIKYVARIVVFPDGGNHQQVTSEAYWEKRYALIQQAISLGANEIQLDYIRYNTARAPSPENAQNVNTVIKWFKIRLAADAPNVPLQIDVFGITSFREEKRIGQYPKLFADNVDVICPMVYPSHYEPYQTHAKKPYDTVYSSLNALKDQLGSKEASVKIYPYIELSNYRYPLSHAQRLQYIQAQLKAANDAQADGWYAWSASNRYDNLFNVLGKASVETASSASF